MQRRKVLSLERKSEWVMECQNNRKYDCWQIILIMVIGEHVNKYLSLNKLGIIKSRTETTPEVGFKRNALH